MNTPRPEWSSVDGDTGDLLALLAEEKPPVPSPREEWAIFLGALHEASAAGDGVIHPNDLRPLLRDRVKPNRVGAFTRRALLQNIVEYTGAYEVSDDLASRNAGKPSRLMRLYRAPGARRESALPHTRRARWRDPRDRSGRRA